MILAGVKSITLHDRAEVRGGGPLHHAAQQANPLLGGMQSKQAGDTPPHLPATTPQVALRDLGSQFYLSEADVGRNRAEACRCAPPRRPCSCSPPRSARLAPASLGSYAAAAGRPRLHALSLRHSRASPPQRPAVPALPAACSEALQELNSSVPVLASAADLTDDLLSQFQVGGGCGRACVRLFLACAVLTSAADLWSIAEPGPPMVRTACCQRTSSPPAPHTSPPPQAQVVVATDTSLAECIRIDDFCHANGIAFIKVRCVGAGAGGTGRQCNNKEQRTQLQLESSSPWQQLPRHAGAACPAHSNT